jgi:hypothetical protein
MLIKKMDVCNEQIELQQLKVNKINGDMNTLDDIMQGLGIYSRAQTLEQYLYCYNFEGNKNIAVSNLRRIHFTHVVKK